MIYEKTFKTIELLNEFCSENNVDIISIQKDGYDSVGEWLIVWYRLK